MSLSDRKNAAGFSVADITGAGKPYNEETIREVWKKAKRQPGFETFSIDEHGSPISFFDYSKRSAYGWVIQRIVPVEQGGSDNVSNLVPLHWKHALLKRSPAKRS